MALAVLFLIESGAVENGDLRGNQCVIDAALRMTVGLNNGALGSLKVENANDPVIFPCAAAVPYVSSVD